MTLFELGAEPFSHPSLASLQFEALFHQWNDNAGRNVLDEKPDSIDAFENSWIGKETNVPEDIRKTLQESPSFQRYVTLSLASQHPNDVDPLIAENMWEYVANGQAALDSTLNEQMWHAYLHGDHTSPSFHFKKQQSFLTAELTLRTFLFTQLMANRGQGCTVETLAEKFMRTGSLKPTDVGDKFKHDVSVEHMKFFLRRPNGELIFPPLPGKDTSGPLAQEILYWLPDEWLKLVSAEDEDYFAEELESGRQPLVSVTFDSDGNTPMESIPNWGIHLTGLSKDEIIDLARWMRCGPECATYHSEIGKQKAMGELVAPVNAKLFADALYETYTRWVETGDKEREKFSVLIPAQADETTIIGILNELNKKGVDDETVKKYLTLTLADLCPTPLLLIYAHLRERGLLDIANITSSNVFNWADPMEQKFHFIGTDHFVDLFSPKGKYSQKKVFASLIDALAPGGTLTLTARCGTTDIPLTREIVMNGFYDTCLGSLRTLCNELTRVDALEGEFIDGEYAKLFPTKQSLARGVYALTAYLALRDVHPFASIDALSSLLSDIQTPNRHYEFTISPIPEKSDKVSIIIHKD